MSYGQNKPAGLVAINSSTSGIYNGQTYKAYIKSAYATSIFRGDLVYLDNDGFIHNLFDKGSPAYRTAQAFGVFNGCSYIQPTANNPTDPASPGRSYWPGGTVTKNSVPASCDIIIDPSVVFTIQANATGLTWESQGATVAVGYTSATGNPDGDTLTGQSSMFLDASTLRTFNNLNLKIIGFDPNPSNPIPIPGGATSPYVNAWVVIQNHTLVQRADSN